MQINKFSLLLLLTGAAFFVLPLKAQVNVGSENTPQPFSLLELTTSIQKGGLRLPQLTTEERDALDITAPNLDAAQGLVIYNTDIDCVEFYNSDKGKWISLCNDTITPVGSTTLPLGRGTVNGKFCFDIARSNDTVPGCGGSHDGWRAKYRADFNEDSIRIQTYTFTPMTTYPVSKLSFEYDDQTGLIVDSLVYNPAYETALNINYDCTATLYYKKSLNEDAYGRTQVNPLTADIYAIFDNQADGTGTKEVIKMTATIKDGACCGSKIWGARTASGAGYHGHVYKVFMCHNLGADESADPFIPAKELHGAKYKWGTGIVAVTAFEDSISTTITDWATRGGTPPNTGYWDMAIANPCPTGYRVPTDDEFWGIGVGYNNIYYGRVWTVIGTLAATTPTNWTSGFLNGQGGDGLFMPAAGERTPTGSVNSSRGSAGYYWSTDPDYNEPSALSGVANASTVFYTRAAASKQYGTPIRCIAE